MTQRGMDGSVCLALQGGGALGAFTWGVLDALVEHGVKVEAASGASAGAVNAVLLAAGILEGGAEGARAKLAGFWRRVGDVAQSGGIGAMAAWRTLDALSVAPSPELLNPLGFNPMRDLLAEQVDFERLRRESPFQLFLSATRVRDGRARVFQTDEITLDVVLASACLPQLHSPVEIDGEGYWDGGYSANPPVLQLVNATRSHDLLVVELTLPDPSEGIGGRHIRERLQIFAFNASLQREIEMLLTVREICRNDPGARSRFAERLRPLRVHRLAAREHLDGEPSRLGRDLTSTGLRRMADAGVAAGRAWLARDDATGLAGTSPPPA